MSSHLMDFKGLQNVLVEKLGREEHFDTRLCLSQPCNDVGPAERDRTVRWLLWLVDEFPFHPRTFALAVCIFDQFLGIVKVHSRYLKCAALTSLHIAIKVVEEDNVIPSTLKLVKAAGARFSPNDMVRMEKIVLSKLAWDVGKPTSYDFLELFVRILYGNVKDIFAGRGVTPESLLEDLWMQLQDCIAQCKFSRFRGSTIALALVSCALERLHPTWFSIVNTYQTLAQVPVGEFLKCREFVKAMFAISRQPKVAKKRSVLRRPHLTPIPENPFEAEYMASCLKREATDNRSDVQVKYVSQIPSIMKSGSSAQPTDWGSFREEYERLQRIDVSEDGPLPAAKRPRIHTSNAVVCC